MIYNLQELGYNMSLKLHFLRSHLNYFLENLEGISEEQEERLHHVKKEMERRCQG